MKECTWIILLMVMSVFNSSASLRSPVKNPADRKQPTWVTSDIDRFYQAFDLARKNPEDSKQIFNLYYFRKGSKGLKDFYKLKIQSKEKFAEFVIKYQDYYESIRRDITDLGEIFHRLEEHVAAFKKLHPRATIPTVYFLIGKFQSNGTISKAGLLIGTEMLSRTSDSDTARWDKALLELSMRRDHIPVTISHELVHFNQDQMKEGNTLLWKSIREGSAEFIAEIITGQTDGDYHEFTGREREVWEDFKEDMDKSLWISWQRASEGRPKNAGYWMGYTICKAYFHQIGQDKVRAVQDILRIQDYGEFLEKSKVEEYLMNFSN